MLDEFILTNRDAIITRTRARVATRVSPKPSDIELTNGIPVFLAQLVDALQLAKSSDVVDHKQMGMSAALHGRDLLAMGLTIAQVVHDYGDVCQVVTELAVQQKAPIPSEEFRTLNLCLDDAIAEAVTEYARQCEQMIERDGTERLGVLAHELGNVLNTALLSFELIKSGRVAAAGSTGMVHQRSLMDLRDLIDRSLADVRLDATAPRFELIAVAEFIEEIEIGALVQARAHDIELDLALLDVDRSITIEGDRQILIAAISNLLRNAFAFTPEGGHVSFLTRVTVERVRFEIEDSCGGLPPGKTADLFRPFEQRGADRSGLGLGLSICLKAAKANRGDDQRARSARQRLCLYIGPAANGGSAAAPANLGSF